MTRQRKAKRILSCSARVDFHSDYGTRFSPRLSALYRPGPWTIRASLGKGFYAPTPFVDEIEAAGLSRLEPLGPLRADIAGSSRRWGRQLPARDQKAAVTLATTAPSAIEPVPSPPLLKLGWRRAASALLMSVST